MIQIPLLNFRIYKNRLLNKFLKYCKTFKVIFVKSKQNTNNWILFKIIGLIINI